MTAADPKKKAGAEEKEDNCLTGIFIPQKIMYAGELPGIWFAGAGGDYAASFFIL